MATPEEIRKLYEASEKSANKARVLLDEDVKAVMDEISRMDTLRPKTADAHTYQELIDVITKASDNNESVAMVKQNIKKLGGEAISLFKEMAKIAKTLI